jgi:diacylglycerol kinase (ATP)
VAGELVFLVNPASANGSTGARWPEISRRAAEAGIVGETLFSTGPGEITALAERVVADGARTIVAVGGDGTVYETVNGLMRADAARVELAVIGRGTGKDFVRSHGIPTSVAGALETIRAGRTRIVDAGRARYTAWDGSAAESWFGNFGGAGISGAIARRANESSKALGGRASFVWATVAVFARWRSEAVEIALGDERRSGRYFEILAMLGEYTAGGMRMAPGASVADGLLDAVLIGDVTKADFVRTFPKVYRGRHLGHPKIELLRAPTVSVEAERPLPVALDGEQPGTTPVTFEVVPNALRLRVP